MNEALYYLKMSAYGSKGDRHKAMALSLLYSVL